MVHQSLRPLFLAHNPFPSAEQRLASVARTFKGEQHLTPAMASSSQNTGHSGTRLGRIVHACLLSGELLEVELSPGSDAEEVRSQVAQRLGLHPFEVALFQDGKKLQDCDHVLGDVSVLVQPFLSQDVIDDLIQNMRAAGVAFSEGMTDEEVRQAEENCKICFPPDLKLFLQTAMPEGPEFPNHGKHNITGAFVMCAYRVLL